MEQFAGIGNPLRIVLTPGLTVVDIGGGAGTDMLPTRKKLRGFSGRIDRLGPTTLPRLLDVPQRCRGSSFVTKTETLGRGLEWHATQERFASPARHH